MCLKCEAKSLTLQIAAAITASGFWLIPSFAGQHVRVKQLLVSSVLVAAVVVSGCGPIQSTSYLLDAEVAIQSAKTAGADKYAPYEYTSALLYIHKAREEVGYSDFEVAVNFAQKASRYANEAREKAMSLAKDAPPPPPLPSSMP